MTRGWRSDSELTVIMYNKLHNSETTSWSLNSTAAGSWRNEIVIGCNIREENESKVKNGRWDKWIKAKWSGVRFYSTVSMFIISIDVWWEGSCTVFNLKFFVKLDTWFTYLIWTVFCVVYSVFFIVLWHCTTLLLIFFCVLYCSFFLYCTVSACDVRAATLTEVFPCFVLSCKANVRV
jgi:hypothetical protein